MSRFSIGGFDCDGLCVSWGGRIGIVVVTGGLKFLFSFWL